MPSATSSRSKDRVPALDALRGIAIMAIMLRHVASEEQRFFGHIGDAIFSVVESAWCGVDLFFVLSGFLITGILLDSKGSQNYFSTFYLRRVIRIIPLYYGILLVGLVIFPRLVPSDVQLQEMATQQAWLWLFSADLLIGWTQHWAFLSNTINLGHFWTLAVEEHFYLLWPLIVLLLDRRRLMWVCVAAMVGALASRLWLHAHGANDAPLFVFTWCRMDALATGAFLAAAIRGPHGLAALTKPAWAVLIATATILGLFIYAQGGHLDYYSGATLTYGLSVLAWFFGAVLIVGSAVRAGTLGDWFWSSGILKFFSRYSYGLFAFQAIPKRFFHAIFPLEAITRFFGSYRVGLGVYCSLVLASMIVMAMLSWHLYEKHFMKLRRHLPYVHAGPPAQKPAAPEPTEKLIQA